MGELGPLIPVKLGCKGPPYLKEWEHASLEALSEIWGRFPGANPGLRLDHYLILDPDDDAAQRFLDDLEFQGLLPPTVAWRTWRGMTVRLFKSRNGMGPVKPPRGASMMLEIRTGAGQYVLIPPAQVNGRLYSWLPDQDPQSLEPAELPQEALNRILKALKGKSTLLPQGSKKRPSLWAELWRGVPEGQRDDTATRLAGRLLSRGLPQDEVAEILHAWNERNLPPLTPREIEKCVVSVSRREDRKNTGMRFITGDDLLSLQLDEPENIISGGILPAGGGLILTGDSGVGKSLLALEIAVLLSHGLPLWDMKVSKPYRVIIFQAENPMHSLKFRLNRITEGHGLSACPDIIITDPRLQVVLPNEKDARKLADLIERAQAEVAILDPLSSYHQANENDNIAIRRVLDSLTAISRQTGCAWIVLHHHGKPNKDKKAAWEFRGASAIRDWADTMVALLSKTEKGSNRILRLLRFDKVRHGPSRADLLLERNQFFCHLMTEEEMKAPPSLVLELLKDLGGLAKLKDLAQAVKEKTGIHRATAYRSIEAAEGRGLKREGPWVSLAND